MTNFQALTSFGWDPFFQQQLSLEEWSDAIPARVSAQHKSIVNLMTASAEINFELSHSMPTLVVGDWILLDQDHQFLRLLDRKTCFKRKSAGTGVDWQFIAANVDTAFIVCSMNEEFNLNRIERYLSLVHSADTEPVIVLTKSDLVDSSETWKMHVQQLDTHLSVVTVNAHESECVKLLSNWLCAGKTIVMLGSSGVGKSTLTNTLLGQRRQNTGGIREDDDKGRHTTTSRSLLLVPQGGLILDTPGMRELQIADCQQGIASTFADIESLAQQCRFSDCQHTNEPGCAVQASVKKDQLEHRRLANYQKLVKEEQFNSASLAQKRAKDKTFGKFIKRTLKESNKLKGR
ncbi:ribosome small subunit-dependent GTPase A [Aliiglaciecola sp. M165]|uniref:ribosome small subunit-dependent GTPase A n=1 Tax=Aliiglaciecola sp. M165 TaxID=2593649 RepID=UPI00117F54D1|nr:ribosome small subunit-dependent GTPase A [Aliiglaciecola sp. M165]TRY29357.1 ribosome small subunit-dependent GTPase A [Aliiglaciecola sp. M165]